MRTLLLTEHTKLTLGGKKTKQSSRSQRENTIPAEKEKEREREREREREVGRRNPRKYTYRAEKKTERTPTNLAILWHQILSRPFMCVPGVAKKQLQLAEKKTPCVKERERESKQEPSREDKTPKKKASKIRSPNSKTLHREFPCTELCPQKEHTHTQRRIFLSSTELCKKKKRKKKTEEEEEEEEEERRRRRNRAGEGG